MKREHEERVVKILLPVALIRQVDEALVAGVGGYTTRTEFFRDAAEGLLLELKYGPAPDEPAQSLLELNYESALVEAERSPQPPLEIPPATSGEAPVPAAHD